jgi:uncharacterized protein with PIN domain
MTERNVQTYARLDTAQGRRCPLCNSAVYLLVYYRWVDTDTQEVLEEFSMCQRCADTEYVLACRGR